MKKSRRLLALLLAAVMVIGTGCSGTAKEETSETKSEQVKQEETVKEETAQAATEEEITLSLWACNGMINADEFKLQESEWYISKAVERFKELYPNVTVEITAYDDNAQVMNDFKAATLAGYGPDVVAFMNGPSLLSVKDGLLPLNDYLDEEMLTNIVGWETCAEDMNAENTIYAIPYAGQSVACFAYNRSLVEQAGLDFENNPPRTIDEFYAALDAIKEAGILPIHSDESYPALLLYCLGMWWEQKTGLDGIIAHTLGDAKYADDEGFLFMLEEYQKFYENGWINEDAASSADQDNVFLQGGSAIHHFFISNLDIYREALGDDLGILAVPTADEAYVDVNTAVGGVGSCLGVSNFSENPEMAVELAKFLVTKEEMTELYKVNVSVPIRADITAEDFGKGDDELFAKLVGMAEGIYYWPDNCMSSDAGNVYYSMPCQVLVGNMTAQELAEELDNAQLD